MFFGGIAALLIVIGGIFIILGEHHGGRLVAGGIALGLCAPLLETALVVVHSGLAKYGGVIAGVALVVLVGAAAVKIRPHHGAAGGQRPSLKRRVDDGR